MFDIMILNLYVYILQFLDQKRDFQLDKRIY